MLKRFMKKEFSLVIAALLCIGVSINHTDIVFASSGEIIDESEYIDINENALTGTEITEEILKESDYIIGMDDDIMPAVPESEVFGNDKKNSIPVDKVKLNKTSVSINTGEKLTLKAKIIPSDATNKSLKWSSSDKSIATVSSKGVVKGVKAGTVTITVTAKDGKKTAKCKVKVKKYVAVKGVKLNLVSASMKIGDKIALEAEINPSDATNKKVEWTSSDTGIAVVSSKGVVEAVASGTAIIAVITKDGGKTAECEITVEDVNEEENHGTIVYIPKTGKRYHSDPNCSGMKNPEAVTVDEAVNRGYTPCKKCF